MKILIEESVLRQALEVLEDGAWYQATMKAMDNLRAAIKEMEQVEPVAWISDCGNGSLWWTQSVNMMITEI